MPSAAAWPHRRCRAEHVDPLSFRSWTMARNKTLFLYNDTRHDQEWTVYAEGVINESYTVGQQRKSFTLSLSGDTTIRFGVDGTVYLRASYIYATDRWTSHTDTPNDMAFSTVQSAVTVTSSYSP
ncbi:hypothetical protein XthCFBP4691_14525 [Xanthomonas theicola]|uniref:Uncharacterized protein n=3 Tax=Xanthomonas theicola TaxID=56464 RepID=A0A2S6ZD10_9XANT|nr:hypothetical protein XthCFBP4691_14525 [Xanthomonas theicola]